MKRSLLLCLLFLIPAACYAGPFGLEMGTPLSELSKIMTLKPDVPYIYSTPLVPKLHPDFDTYQLVVTPNQGLCKVLAYSRLIKTSAYGSELVSKFNTLNENLTLKYGSPKRYDFVKQGSIWQEPRDWLMGLRKNERTIASIWSNEKRELPDNINLIQIKAKALGLDHVNAK
ncbi:MAG: hypothetical protein Q7S71_00170 [Candidatus Nitrotoga sp.]|nr:hypothetical protein [Candidatus Nitrotoga sp.]